MKAMVMCACCGKMIGSAGYKTDGDNIFHADCQAVVRHSRMIQAEENPMGSDLCPVAMNFTKCSGTEIVMVSANWSAVSG